MDLSKDNLKGRVGGTSTTTVDLEGENVSETTMQEALSRLENIGQIQVCLIHTNLQSHSHPCWAKFLFYPLLVKMYQ